MLHKHGPLVLTDPQSFVGRLYVAAEVMNGSTASGTQEINDKLTLPFHAVLTFSLPIHTDVRIGR